MGDYYAKQASPDNRKVQEKISEKLKLEQRLDEIGSRLDEIKENIRVYDDQIASMNRQLMEAAPYKECQKQKELLEKGIEFKNQELKSTYQQLFKLFGTDSYSLFLNHFVSSAQERMKQMDIGDKGIPGIEGKAIQALINRGVCLCGTDLVQGTSAYKNVAQYIDYLPPKSIGIIVKEVMDTIQTNDESSRRFSDEFEVLYSRIQMIKNQINNDERQLKDLLKDMAKIAKIDVSIIEQHLFDNRRRISELREEERKLFSERSSVITNIETTQRIINQYLDVDEKAQRYKRYYKYAEAIYNYVSAFYEKKEEELRKRLSENVTELFNCMYSGERDVCVDEKYNLIMKYQGKTLDDTGGLRILQYFAYVGGLVKLAGEILNEKDSESSLGEHYPLVLDAAFSHADSSHIRNISRELSQSTDQLVFALMFKDWTYADEGLKGKVVRTYELMKIDETEVQIKEVI